MHVALKWEQLVINNRYTTIDHAILPIIKHGSMYM